jgi:hypothetical protein
VRKKGLEKLRPLIRKKDAPMDRIEEAFGGMGVVEQNVGEDEGMAENAEDRHPGAP